MDTPLTVTVMVTVDIMIHGIHGATVDTMVVTTVVTTVDIMVPTGMDIVMDTGMDTMMVTMAEVITGQLLINTEG